MVLNHASADGCQSAAADAPACSGWEVGRPASGAQAAPRKEAARRGCPQRL